ncbi:MAG: ComF family protein [Phycisphaerales bacterium]|nr:ComF family protein [Phycisphaerales bacterium]
MDTAIPWQQLVRLGAYESPLKDWVLALKYHRQWHWGQWLGQAIGRGDAAFPDDRMTAICPVPMHWRRRWIRHYNQAMLIARGICEHRPWPMLDLLVRHVHRPSQTHVAPAARRENVRHCMKALPYDLRGWHIWLVDDVKTSGATLSQCARLLQERGAESIHVAVACVANPRDHQ